MELTKQERKLAKSTAEAYGSLSLGSFALALIIGDAQWEFWFLIGLGAVSALFSIFICLALFCRWERNRHVNKFLIKLVPAYASHLVWLVGLGELGISLQDKGHTCWGAACGFLGIAIFTYRMCKGGSTSGH
jgi:hypothetical protein